MAMPRHDGFTKRHRKAIEGMRQPFRLDYGSDGWRVVDADGRPMSGFNGYKAGAELMLDHLERAARLKLRKCLRCRAEFWSEGAHNRLCGCQAEASDYLNEPFAVGSA